MNISTAITAAMAMNLGLSNAEIEKAAIDFDLVTTDVYVKGNLQSVNAAAAQLLAGYLLIKSRSEGGFSITFNTEEIKNRLTYVAKNSGGKFIVPAELQVLDRKVRGRHNIW